MTTVDEKPTIEERYTNAMHASNLRVELDRLNVADILIAAGWSRNQFGVSLMNLLSEWDCAAKPSHLSSAATKLLANQFTEDVGKDGNVEVEDCKGEKTRVKPAVAAQLLADQWHENDLRKLFERLKSLPKVRNQLADFAWFTDMDGGQSKAAAVIGWYLHNVCGHCGGGKWQLVPGSDRRSGKACMHCKGSGKVKIPYGLEGRKLVDEIEAAIHMARCGMSVATSNRDKKPS